MKRKSGGLIGSGVEGGVERVDGYKSVSWVEVSEGKVRWSGCWGLGGHVWAGPDSSSSVLEDQNQGF